VRLPCWAAGQALPHAVTVIGGADTGCQMASIFADLGADVRLFEAGPRLVPGADPSISAALGQAFAARSIEVITGATVRALERGGEQAIVHFTRGGPSEQAKAEAIFAAVGWPANLQDLDLGAAGVTSDPRAIGVDDYLRSAETVQVVAAAMSAGMNVEQLAEIQFAFPTFTEAVSMAAQRACRNIGIGRFPPAWSYLGSDEDV
jgi:pyruvate/2-oxoglutarate dehydrogenase complex dihydrolipoamide dehydrogenase (E3) component